MNETWKHLRAWAIAAGACMLALGIFMVAWPNASALAICYLLGALCVATGIYELVRYFKLGLTGLLFRFDLTLGLCGILAGLLLLLHPGGAAVLLPIAAGLYMLIGGVFDIQLSVELRRCAIGDWWLTLALGIISAVCAFFLLLNPFEGAAALMIFTGAALIISGIRALYTVGCISRALRSGQGRTIEVQWTPCE